VEFAFEHSIDAGGPFRELLSVLSTELQSSDLPLFIPSPNARSAVGADQDKWVPRPALADPHSSDARHPHPVFAEPLSPLLTNLYEFVGKLMGMSMRTGCFLNLDFAACVWKHLVQEEVETRDLAGVDLLSQQLLTQLRALVADDSPAAEDTWAQCNFTWSAIGSDQRERRLSGLHAPHARVDWRARHTYLQALERYRLTEFAGPCAAMRRGLSTVVPFALLSLFTAAEIEAEVVGLKQVDVDFLSANTEYEGCSAADPHVQRFWEVLRLRFDDDLRAKLLRFTWGRSRLPLPGEAWERRFKLARHRRSENWPAARVDTCLPESHTCFFTLDLPKYSSVEVCYHKLLYAINNCTSVDGDGSLNAGGTDLNADVSDNDE